LAAIEIAKSCASEQSIFLKQWLTSNDTEKGLTDLNSSSKSSLYGYEKDMIKIQGEVSRVKGRQDSIENLYRDLRQNIQSRDGEYEDLHKKSLNSYRNDMKNVLDSLVRKVNEQFMTLTPIQVQKESKLGRKELRNYIDDHMTGLNDFLQKVVTRIQSCEDDSRYLNENLSFLTISSKSNEEIIHEIQNKFNNNNESYAETLHLVKIHDEDIKEIKNISDYIEHCEQSIQKLMTRIHECEGIYLYYIFINLNLYFFFIIFIFIKVNKGKLEKIVKILIINLLY
jgi:chromosome segregation ATPase